MRLFGGGGESAILGGKVMQMSTAVLQHTYIYIYRERERERETERERVQSSVAQAFCVFQLQQK
jgi:hypothetical protein